MLVPNVLSNFSLKLIFKNVMHIGLPKKKDGWNKNLG